MIDDDLNKVRRVHAGIVNHPSELGFPEFIKEINRCWNTEGKYSQNKRSRSIASGSIGFANSGL